MELMVSMLILLPLMGAAMSLFSVGAKQQAREQGGIDVNQEARTGMEMMTREIAQAGSHRDTRTTLNAQITADSTERSYAVASTVGFHPGDWVDIDAESIQLTAVTSNSISGVFTQDHDSGAEVRLFAFPFVVGVIPPAGLGANGSTTVTTLRFFGDINGDVSSPSSDPNLSYVEYRFDSTNNQITRSMTGLDQASKSSAIPFIRNLAPNSVQFTVSTNDLGVITSVNISMTVQNYQSTVKGTNEQTQLSSRVLIPSAVAGSALEHEYRKYGGVNKLPPTPSIVTTWASL